MANTRISDLTASASNLASTDLAPVVQTANVGPVKMTGLQLAGGLLGSTTFNGSTVTTSSPVLNLTQTWNDGAVTFTGLKFNATDTASASGSLLLDLQVGGASQFNLSKSGVATFVTGSKTAPPIKFTGLNGGMYGRASGFVTFTNGTVEMAIIGSSTGIGCCNGISLAAGGTDLSTTGSDLFLLRPAAATLQLGAADAAAPVAQTFKVQSVVAGTTNTAGANFTIQGSQGTGTGAGGSIIFQVAPAGSSGTAQNAYSTALTINSSSQSLFANGSAAVPSISFSSTTNTGFYYGGVSGYVLFSASGTQKIQFGPDRLAISDDQFFAWQNPSKSGLDLLLYRDAANTLALRNGGTSGSPVPQTFRVYNWTDGTNSEYVKIGWSGNSCSIATEKSGTGASRALLIRSTGQINLTPDGDLYFGAGSNPQWAIGSGGATAGNLLAYADNTYDIGASGTTSRVRTIYSGGGYSAAAPTIKTANYSQGIHDYSLIFNGTGSITLTLLAASTYPGKILYVKTIAAQTVVSASSNVKPIDTDTAGTAILAATAGKWAMLQSDGTNWVIMAQG